MANNLLRLLPYPHDIMADQHWEQPTDLSQAKNLLGRLRSSITRRAHNAFFHPQSKTQNVLLFTHTVWSKMEQEIMDNLITYGRANATHFCLRHNPARVNGESDKGCIHRKIARFTIARVLVKSRYSIDIKEKALLLWINNWSFSPSTTRTFFLKRSSRSCVTGSPNSAAFSLLPNRPLPPTPRPLTYFVVALLLLLYLWSNLTPKEVVFQVIVIFLYPHLSSEFQRSSMMCLNSLFPSVYLVPILFCNDILNLTLRAMRGGCSTSSVF